MSKPFLARNIVIERQLWITIRNCLVRRVILCPGSFIQGNEVVDHELRKKGQLLGRCEVPVNKLATENKDGTYVSNGTLTE